MKNCRLARMTFLSATVFSVLMACIPRPTPAANPPSPPIVTPSTSTTPLTSPVTSTDADLEKLIAAAKKEGRVTPYSYFFAGDTGQDIAKAFWNTYGIEVQPVTGFGIFHIERIKSEQAANKFIGDTLDTTPTSVLTAKTMGLTQSVGNLPALRTQAPFLSDPVIEAERHLIGLSPSLSTPFINTNLVKSGQEPRSFKELLDPKWKGKIVTFSPWAAPALVELYVAAKRHGVLDDSYFVQLSKQNLILKGSTNDAILALTLGEAYILIGSANTLMNPLIKEGAPIRPIDMEEGIPAFLVPAIAMVKNAPHPNAARLFINWLLSPEGQIVYHKSKGLTPLRKDVTDFAPPGGQLRPKKLLLGDLEYFRETSRLQREGTVAKLMGVEK